VDSQTTLHGPRGRHRDTVKMKLERVNPLLHSKSQSRDNTQIKGRTLDILGVFSSIEIFYHRNPLDTVHGRKSSHMMASSHSGFFLFYHHNLHGACPRTVIQPPTETTGLLISWVFSFLPRQRIDKVGVSFEITPMGTITYTHSPRTGVDSSRHTHGSESSPIVQGLVQDLNVYKTHGV